MSVKLEKNVVKFLKYFMKYFRAKNVMKFYITNCRIILIVKILKSYHTH